MKLVVNESLPRALRRALERDARGKNTTLNDVAGEILAEHYGIEWVHSGRSYERTSDRFRLKVPDAMHRLLLMEAADRLGTLRGVAIGTLEAHYGTRKNINVGRRPRGGK
jgi:hypothetical protein